MKIGGVPVTEPTEELLVLPRSDKSFVFRGESVARHGELQCSVSDAEAPWCADEGRLGRGRERPELRRILSNWHMQRAGYMIVHTLSPSNIEWDTIDGNNPKTWTRWEDEMRKAGFTQA
jgi:hypothetical protein